MQLGFAFAALAIVAGVLYRLRLRRVLDAETALSDDMVRQIEETGWLELEPDEPLDLDEIRDEEERFLGEEAWEEPDEW